MSGAEVLRDKFRSRRHAVVTNSSSVLRPTSEGWGLRAAIDEDGSSRHQRRAQGRGPPLAAAHARRRVERMFTLAFSKLVYPQIWEDPVVDMQALDIGPGHQVIAIASGGCNVLSYLIADRPASPGSTSMARYRARPAQDLRASEPARLRKLFRFFGRADARANIGL